MRSENKIPIMEVGKYAGVPVDQLPHSYLRWIMTKRFSREILEVAQAKLKKSDFAEINLSISRHALDMFSKHFLFRWIQNENIRGEEGDGLATYVAKSAQEAWEKGSDVSKRRYEEDGIIKDYAGVRWVFKVNPDFPEYKDVVTVIDTSID